MQEIISYSKAKSAGLKTYFTGKPCKYGHICQRYVSSKGCLECVSTRQKLNRKNNPERTREVCRAQYLRDREKIIIHHKKRYHENPDIMKQYSKIWRSNNKEKHHESLKKWRSENKDIVRVHANNRRCRLRGVSGSHTIFDICEIIERQKYKCVYCGKSVKKSYHVDHIQPISKGGGNGKDNLQICCPTCNLRKHAKDPIDFAQELGLLI